MQNVIPFPLRSTVLMSESERASSLDTWLAASDAQSAMRADLCIACSCPTSAHVDTTGRHRGCEYALHVTPGRMA